MIASEAGTPAAGRPVTTGRRARRPVFWRELLLGLATFAIYSVVAGANWPGRHDAAIAHANSVFRLEQRLHLDVEPALNRLLLRHDLLRSLANYEYAFTYIVSAFLLLGWLYVRRPQLYRWARTWFIILNLAGVACFALYPVAPPRLVAALGFNDTVLDGHTWGSWGSPLVDHANELAAMPSLHFAWALWVSVVLALISGTVRTQLVSCVHVLVTIFVILATANHFLFDAVGGAVLITVTMPIAGWLTDRAATNPWRAPRVKAADVFFLHAQTPESLQQVGGLVLLEVTDGRLDTPTVREVQDLVSGVLGHLPRFTQRLSSTTGSKRPRWIEGDIDWDWHVIARDITTTTGEPGGLHALNEVVAEFESTPLPLDRPLWRIVVVHGVTENRTGLLFLVHHVVADGFGTVAQALHLLEPELPAREISDRVLPGRAKVALATATGLAQLATDGGPAHREALGTTGQRSFGTVRLSLDEVRTVARSHGARVSDVLMCVVAGALARTLDPETATRLKSLRTSVPLMVREPDADVEANVTAAVMIDLPIDVRPEAERLALIAGGSARLRSGTRALASRFVMDAVGEVLPAAGHAWFARTVYGWRYFQAIVSNMPGPEIQLSLAGHRLDGAFPILPLAPGAPLAIGALGWSGQLCFGISAHPSLVPDIVAFENAIRDAFGDLQLEAIARAEPSAAVPG